MPDDHLHMDRYRELADQASRAGNTAVGSVLVVGTETISEGIEAVPTGPDPFAHAELLAVRDAMIRFGRTLPKGATLYTTNEPCILCSFALREAGIARVVIGAPTADIGGVTSSHPILVTNDVSRWKHPPVVTWWDEDARKARP